MYSIISVHFVDKLQHPIKELKYRINSSGNLIYSGETSVDGKVGALLVFDKNATEAEKVKIRKIAKTVKKEVTLQSEDIEIVLITDNGKEKSLVKAKVKWGQRQIILARSDWIKVNFPLSPKDDEKKTEAAARTETCGYAEVTYESGRPGSNNFATVSVVICDVPKKIVDIALKYRGSTLWAVKNEKIATKNSATDQEIRIPANRWKCSLFVYDVLLESGLAVPVMERGSSTYIPYYSNYYNPLADDWANSNKLKNWKTFNSPMPGDVGAYKVNYSNATGHCGIVVAPGVTISAGQDKVLVNDAGFRVAKMNKKAREMNAALSSTEQEHDFSVFRRHKTAI
jgi:hypothetical protein